MIETASITTLQLAMLIGLYELAAGFVSVTGRIDWTAMLDEFDRSPALAFVTGFVVFAIGGTMVMVHQRWSDPLAMIVSLVGWIALAEGLLMLLFARPILIHSRPLVRYPKLIGAVAMLFGAFMLLAGLIGRTPSIP